MTCPFTRRACLILGASLLVAPASGDRAGAPDESAAVKLPPAVKRSVEFASDIQPIFKARCLSCHGPEKHQGGLRLDIKELAVRGGGSGRAFEPGRSAESLLVSYVAGADPEIIMPPKGERLTAEQVGLLRAWIDQGANWPDEAGRDGADRGKPGSNHWAFRPIGRPAIPPVKNTTWVRNSIDAFVLANLESKGIAPSPEADRPTLIRRLTLDVLGLPPTPEEVSAFSGDQALGAVERLVDRLLASPHFGERWGRHWLDLARYADSDGYEKDSSRPNAWRYRDWVIGALNRDLPFDAFSIDQIAGDLVPDADLWTRTATGFHRNTLTNREGGVDEEEYRIKAVVDRVNTTGTVWLGLTVGCAQCHSHKYDPIYQREYYGLFAFFNTETEEDIPSPLPSEQAAYEKAKSAFDADHKKLTRSLEAYEKADRPAKQTDWEALPPKGVPEDVAKILAVGSESRTKEQEERLAAFHRSIDPEWVRRKNAVTDHAKKKPPKPASSIPGLAENPKHPKTHVLIRGDFLRKGEEVDPRTPAFLPGIMHSGTSATRLDLARWLVDRSNPLTRRVTANRIWHHLFGRGLVTTLDDFGTRGDLPSHPELLDWLACQLLDQGWSQKAFIKTIVTSATYRQASQARADCSQRDPANIWLSRQNRLRLEAEVLRDVSLAASGLLTPVIGGPSVHPPQPAGISELTYAGGAKWKESTGPDRYRRGLYTWFQRTSPYPMLMTFDAPDSNVCAVKRERSNTPLQALTLLNDVTFFECARALGQMVVREAPSRTDDRLCYLFTRCLARAPAPEELNVLSRLHDRLTAEYRDHRAQAAIILDESETAGSDAVDSAAWVAVARAVLNLDEFVTRE
jgi:hypothetical protein